MTNFTRKVTLAIGVLLVDLTIGTKTSPTAFFVVDVNPSYSLLLGLDWIHAK
jgi:hypothetical protein